MKKRIAALAMLFAFADASFESASLAGQVPTAGDVPVTVADQAPSPDALQEASRNNWRLLRVAKWTTAAGGTGLAVWGVVNNRRADELFEELERECLVDPDRCDDRLPDGAYADGALESRYQDVRHLDRQARSALIAGQVGLAASVVLFILDLRNSAGPANIPYEPRRIDITPSRDGGLTMRLNLPVPANR
ncbi:MAG: hypothetical protein KFH98_08175 [Gemmatimonadetes bacterium]|nr:hypothetical protein [Gemmatimonadota bacterium]